jgi:hypothetical protein
MPKTTPLPAGRQLIFNPRTVDLKEYEALARRAKAAGFTHLYISQLSGRTDFRGENVDSPWTEWSNIMPSFFKHATPPGMEDAFPAAFVKREMAWMKRKHAICAKLGMRAAYFATEPLWISERVYEKHPEWRGSRCDNSLRTTGLFFAPNTDHPEVREAYRRALEIIVAACPLLDTFVLHTNDCGAGYHWTERLYVNPNGATGYENRDMGERVAGFLDTVRQGALDGGAQDPRVFTSMYGWFKPQETHLVARSLKPGIGCVGVFRHPDPALVKECSLANAGGWSEGGGAGMDPILRSYPQPLWVMHAAAHIQRGPAVRFDTGGVSTDYFDALQLALELPPPNTPSERLKVLLHMASGLYGADVAEEVVSAWQTMDRAETLASVAGAPLFVGPVMLRWLVRPLVAHQELLTPAEKAYWTRWLYQSEKSQPDTYLDYVNCSGYRLVDNWADASRTAITIDSVEGTLNEAAMQLKAASQKAKSRAGARKLLLDHYRVLAKRSMYLTMRHVVQVATLTYLRDAQGAALTARGESMGSISPERPDLPHGNMGSIGLFYLHRALRWELDNTHALIKILEECPEPLFYTAPSEAHEGSLVLGPNLLADLKRKVRIMLKHWRDAEVGWYRPTLGG